MSIKPRLAIACAAAAAATLMVGPAALAAPPRVTFTATCPDPLGTFEVVVLPGDLTPAFAVGTHQVFIPYRITGTITVDGQEPIPFDDFKKAPVPADAITCTFEGTVTEDDVTATITGTALVVQRGAPM